MIRVRPSFVPKFSQLTFDILFREERPVADQVKDQMFLVPIEV
jgi:hypothetical protein